MSQRIRCGFEPKGAYPLHREKTDDGEGPISALAFALTIGEVSRCQHKPKAVAKVAAARRLAVRLYWILRPRTPYPAAAHIESSPRAPLVGPSEIETLIGRSRIQTGKAAGCLQRASRGKF